MTDEEVSVSPTLLSSSYRGRIRGTRNIRYGREGGGCVVFDEWAPTLMNSKGGDAADDDRFSHGNRYGTIDYFLAPRVKSEQFKIIIS